MGRREATTMHDTTTALLLNAVAAAYAVMKCVLASLFWFRGGALWADLFRPLADSDFGSLLGAKWIGTRNLALGVTLLVVTALGERDLVGVLLAMGVLVELLDGLWLAYGKLRFASSGRRARFYMIGAFAWVPVLTLAAVGFLRR
ncbi:MAG: DUF4267 domain-containing protein [Actinomycetota bacterium]